MIHAVCGMWHGHVVCGVVCGMGMWCGVWYVCGVACGAAQLCSERGTSSLGITGADIDTAVAQLRPGPGASDDTV